MGIYFRVKETATNQVKFGVIPVRFCKSHLKKAKESLESLSSCGKMLPVVNFTENPRKNLGNPRKSSGNPREMRGIPLEIRGIPLEIPGKPLKIYWKSEDVQRNPRKSEEIHWKSTGNPRMSSGIPGNPRKSAEVLAILCIDFGRVVTH